MAMGMTDAMGLGPRGGDAWDILASWQDIGNDRQAGYGCQPASFVSLECTCDIENYRYMGLHR